RGPPFGPSGGTGGRDDTAVDCEVPEGPKPAVQVHASIFEPLPDECEMILVASLVHHVRVLVALDARVDRLVVRPQDSVPLETFDNVVDNRAVLHLELVTPRRRRDLRLDAVATRRARLGRGRTGGAP